ncbi:MAG: D-aminoacyl-tRNA deacylase [Xanthomonadales bacterium]|nr:D-aminoacyl-tRNA deacylase [Xanthomonadales bacterium]
MIGLLQRVSEAWVDINGERVGAIETGLMVLVGVEPGDGEAQMRRLLERLLNYRVFPDDQGRMNLSLRDIQGGLLLVPQFTLAADTRKGNRPGFSTAAPPELGQRLFEAMVSEAQATYPTVGSGVFGADMQVGLVNDGPVTLWLHVH